VPVPALLFNALVWGTSWWPLRLLQQHGLHPLWATAMVYGLAVAALVVWRPRSVVEVLRTPALWVLLLAAGATNACFNWGVSIGDVVRVVLLFYLMPLWAALLARALLHEPFSRMAALRVALALVGAMVVLWPDDAGLGALPLPHSLPDWLGLAGGFAFALNNVMLRREARRNEASRALAMFAGGMLVSAVLALLLGWQSAAVVPLPPAPDAAWLAIAGALALVFMASNLALQYGASRLPANVTSVVMISEVVFAAVSSALWGGEALSLQVLAGGALIVSAALLAALEPASREPST